MKTGLFVSLALALAMMIGVPSTAGAVGLGKQCGGFIGIQCDAGLFCQFKPGSCGFFDMTGVCTRMPKFCPRIFRPVCGCDGKTYGNDCTLQAAGVSKRHDGKCTPW
jgi:Kazal-type serine protease inhibitor domain